MGTTFYSLIRAAVVLGIICMAYACAVTTDATKSSSKTLHNTTDASSKFTSSTSPGYDESASVRKEQTLAFSRVKLERIKTDMAVGGGEHLTSLATLLGIPARNQQDFFALTRANFSSLFETPDTSAEELLARLDDELNAHPHLLE